MIPDVLTQCETCDAATHTTRRRLNLPGTPYLCNRCFAVAMLKSPEEKPS